MSIISSIHSSNAYVFGTIISSLPSTLSLPSFYLHRTQQQQQKQQQQRRRCYCALKTGSQESNGHYLLRKPVVTHPSHDDDDDDDANSDEDDMENIQRERWVDWEDQILEDTVPLVGFVRMILHSGKYQSGDRLSAEHERTILERLLPYHPECDKKIGCGVDYITIGYHPQFQDSRCMFIVRKDGELIDFSYWKCIKGFIRKNYPLYAESFILKHFRRRRRYE